MWAVAQSKAYKQDQFQALCDAAWALSARFNAQVGCDHSLGLPPNVTARSVLGW